MPTNYSRERRRTVLSLLRDKRFRDADLSESARITYAVSALACDENGRITRPDMAAALADPSTLQAAETLLRKAWY